MDDVTTRVYAHALSEKQAMERIIKFAQRYGSLHEDLASHAAFPLVLTPDLLYRIWASFLPQIPWTTVSDILLSPLCREVGYELYEMDPAIRNILLGELREDNRFGESRFQELAHFLQEYILLNLSSDDPDERDLAEAQHLTALASTAPDQAAREIASKLSDPSQLAGADLLRVTALTATLAGQLQEHSPLLNYARGVERLVQGDKKAASDILNHVFQQDSQIEISGVTLRRPRPVPEVVQAPMEETSGAETTHPVIEETNALAVPKIFISYRRADSKYVVDRIRDRFATEFGEQSVFRDLEYNPAGVDFRTVFEREINSCNVMLVVIGPQWTYSTDAEGNKRLFEPGDFTRREIEIGLANPNTLVIPVLVMNATMPSPRDIPESIRDLLSRNAISLRNDPDFNHDIERLIRGIHRSQESINEDSERPFSEVNSSKRESTVDAKNYEQAVFISYAWGGESERIVNELDTDMQNRGIKVVRDKRDLGFKGMIRDFMQQVGHGHAVIIVISDKYLKSPNCMFELVEIAKNKDLYDRIFPIVLADSDIYNPVNRIKYIKYWENKLKELDEAMRSVNSANLQGMREEIDTYDEIRDNISNLTFLLKDMNTLTPEMHENSNFASLISALEMRIADAATAPVIVRPSVKPVESKAVAAPASANKQEAYLADVINRLTQDEYKELRGERTGDIRFKKAMEKTRKGFLGSRDYFRVMFVQYDNLNDTRYVELENDITTYARELNKKLINNIFLTCVVLCDDVPQSVQEMIYSTARPKVGITNVSIVVMVAYSAAENDIFYPQQLPDNYESHFEENIKQYLIPYQTTHLPEGLIGQIESVYSDVRLRAVQQLSQLLVDENLGLARSARAALERMEEDNSRRVVQAAAHALEAIRQTGQTQVTTEKTSRSAARNEIRVGGDYVDIRQERIPKQENRSMGGQAGIAESKSQSSTEILRRFKSAFNIDIDGDWRESGGEGKPGTWTLTELDRLYNTIALMADILGGNEKLISNFGGVTLRKADIGTHGGEALARRVSLSTKGTFSPWTVVHELAHAWDANYGWRLSAALEKYTGGTTNLLRSLTLRLTRNWDAGSNGPERKPGRYGRLPGCNAAGYFYGDKPSGSNWSFNRKEDFAESVAMYIGWERNNDLSQHAKARIIRFKLENGEKDGFGVIDNWADYAKYFYPEDGDYSTTKRWHFVDDLIKGKIEIS